MFRQYLGLPLPIYVLCVGSFINRAGSFLIPFLTLYLKDKLGLGAGVATLAMGAYGFGALVATLVGGHLADLIGRRIVMLVALFGSAVVLAVFQYLQTPIVIYAAAFLLALIAEMYRPAAAAMIADLTTPAQRNHAFGLMYFSINLGFCVSPIVGGELARVSYGLLFWGDAATCAAYALIIAIMIRETLPALQKRKLLNPTATADSGAADKEEDDIPLIPALKHMLRDRPFVIFCLASFLGATVFMQGMSTFPLYLQRVGQSLGEAGEHLTRPETYGRLIAINGIMIVVLQLPITAIVSRFRRGSMITLGTLLMAVGFGLNIWAASILFFAVTIVIWTLGELLEAPVMQAVVSDMAPTALRGRYMGVFSMSFSSAMMIGMPLGGQVLERFGGRVLWTGAFVVGIVSMLLFMSIMRQMDARTDEPQPKLMPVDEADDTRIDSQLACKSACP